ncbi:MAG: GH116 family glycosyl hydrolase [Phycisphaeraceae bacterium]
MPMGGIGAGCLCLNGHGGLQDFSIHHAPHMSALPDGHDAREAAFALLHIKGEHPITKLLEGPMPPEKLYDQGLQSQGHRHSGHEGLPRFETASFTAAYPFGHVNLTHPQVPLAIAITGFSPFIPLDDRSSSMPCAIIEYTLTNDSDKLVEFEFSFHVSHMAPGGLGRRGDRNAPIQGFGVSFTNTEHPHSEKFGSLAFGVMGHKPHIKAMWMRSGWFDWITALWREVSSGHFKPNAGNTDRDFEGLNGGSIMVEGQLASGTSITYPVVIAWHFPNCHATYGGPPNSQCGDDCRGQKAEHPAPRWRPYYAGQWNDASEVALRVRDDYQSLRSRTSAFRDAISASTAPPEILDAVASNLAIIKSPTLLRQENGNLWAWEGCFCTSGCCAGSCTHVWNYAQAIPHLFPQLERSFREQELERSMDQMGHITFRSALPDGPANHSYHAAADGQLGGIMKVYRDWQISGDQTWLTKMLPLVKRSIEFCIERWDPKRQGALVEPHHNTYDIEFWGPDAMCTSIYLGALCAMAAMCQALGHGDDAKSYRQLAQRSAEFMDDYLYNGEYYHQQVMWRELRDQSFVDAMARVDDRSTEVDHVQKAEGPKYQYANGCLSDGVIGAWMCRIYGIDTPINVAHVKSSLAAIHKYNFKPDLFEHAVLQRPGYALGHEGGLIVCTWPHNDRPTLPFVYCDEVWTGMEYQVASHMIAEGMVQEGVEIVRTARARYEGHVRNPFNEYECGSYYARALSSFALLTTYAGFRYSAVDHTLHLNPRSRQRPFTTFFSTATAWGTVTLSHTTVTIKLVEGRLPIRTLVIGDTGASQSVAADVTAEAGQQTTIATPPPVITEPAA